jgi:glycine betaine/proline transport system substrate-binding protein
MEGAIHIMKRTPFLVSSIIISSVLLSACGDNENTGDNGENNGSGAENNASGENGEIEIGLNNWAENIASSNLWKVILEEEGYDVTLTMSEKSPIWVGIANGDLDATMNVWLPTTDDPYYEEHEDNVEIGESWFEGTGLGLVVPEYVDINSIEELNENAEMFNEEIVGIDAGASLTALTEDAMEVYELEEYDFLISSEPAMISELDSAYSNEEPVLVTLWNPHWTFSDYDLKYLEDPENVYGEPEEIYYMTRTGFREDHEEIAEWWDNWEMDDETLGELMTYINDVEDEEEGARQWVEDNRELVDEWTQ